MTVNTTAGSGGTLSFTYSPTGCAVNINSITVVYTTGGGSTSYSVTYDANGATSGSVPEDDNEYEKDDEVTVLGNTGSLAKTGYYFGGWNTQADGEGTNYTAGNTFTISANTTLYAKWNAYTVTAQSNNNTLGTVSASGYVITAAPAEGSRYASPAYTVSSGTATVAQDGNEFTVTPSSDCTVTINFEVIPTHTVTFSVNGNTDRTATVAEGSSITFPTAVETTPGDGEFPKVVNGKTFVGWYTSEYSHSTTAPSYVNTASATMGAGNVTYYAVYADVEEAESDDVKDAVKSQTLEYDTWTYSGSTTDKTSYRMFHTNSYIESAAFDLSKLIKVVVKGGTFGGGTYNSLTIGDGTNTWNNVTVSGNSETGNNEYTDGTALSGTKALRITCNSGTESNNTGVRISKVEIYVKGTNTTYVNFTTDNRASAGISFANASVDAQLTSGYTGQELTNANSVSPISYSSSDETVATINTSTGVITKLLKAGSTTITATFAGNATYKPAEVSYDLNVTEKTPHGLAYATDAVEKLTTDAAFTNTLTNSHSLTVSYSSSATGVATVSSTGEVTIKGAGSTTITATFAGDEDYEAGDASYTLTVSKATPTLSFASANATLRQGKDFEGNALTNPAGLTVSYSSSTTSVATADPSTGAPTFVAAGSTTITASFAGNDTYTSAEAAYTLKVLAAPTISLSDDDVDWGDTYTFDASGLSSYGDVTITSGNTSIATVDGLVITPVAVGNVTITVSTAENETYDAGSATFDLTVTAPAGSGTALSSDLTLFNEAFNKNNGTGGNDGKWNGSIASDDFNSDNGEWNVTNAKGANKCAKFGTSSEGGSAKTPDIELEDGVLYTLTFKAGAWDKSGEGTSLSLSAENATIRNEANTAEVSSVTMTLGEWTSYTLKLIVTDDSDPSNITFSTSGGNKRFFLDEVKVTKHVDPTVAVTLNAYGYATYCSQYPLDFSAATGYTAWYVSSTDVSKGTITFSKITGSIKGGQGIFLHGEANATVNITSANSTNVLSENMLVGTLAPTYLQQVEGSTKYAYSTSNNAFMQLADGIVMPANKAYLPVTSGSPARMTFIFEDDTTTGIKNLDANLILNNKVYDLQGRRVENPKKGGLYIVNGKKTVMK